MSTHRCPVPGCGHYVLDRYLMCHRHWLMVPYPLQQAVYRANAARGSIDGLRNYRLAVKAAIESIPS